MKIVIEIPEAFREHWEKDRFGESLCRLSGDAHLLAGNYEKELCNMLFIAFRRAVHRWNERMDPENESPQEVNNGPKRL